MSQKKKGTAYMLDAELILQASHRESPFGHLLTVNACSLQHI